MGLFSLASKTIKELVGLGYPESVAKKIADGTLPMDEASREARAGLMGMTNDTYYRGHPSARPPTSNDDMFVAKERRDIAETYASGGEAYDEATDSYIELPGEVTPLRTNASKFIEADGMGDDWTYPVAKIPGIGEGVGTDEIAALTKQSRERYGNDLQGSLFTNIRDDIGGELPPGDIANILGSQPEVKIRHADKAAFDPEYSGPNIMGSLLAGGVGLGALGQSEDADAGVGGLFTKEALEQIAKKSGDTQVATTGGSYEKAGKLLEDAGIFDNVLDYGAGRGHGTQHLPGNAQSYEPNPKPGYSPDFTESPDASYDGIANLNVLNVVPEPVRSEIAGDIIGKLNKDGVAAIGARSHSDVMNAKNPTLLDDGGIITQKGTYQYGFGGDNEGLVDYLKRQTDKFPDRKYEVTPTKLAATGALVKRLESIMGPTVAAGLAGGAALAPEDAEAGVSFGLAKNVDLDRLISAWRKAVSREPDINPSTHLQNIIHNKEFTNYNDWTQYARKADGGKNGDTYFNELKPFLLDISKHPSVAKDNRLRRGLVDYADTRFAQRKKQGHVADRQRGEADPYSLLPVAGVGAAAASLTAPYMKDSGIASPVRSETLGDITMGLRGLERNLRGSPMSLLFPEGLTNYLETVNRETEDPNMLTRAMALLDVMP